MAGDRILFAISLLIQLINTGLCGDLDVGHYPPSLRFGTAPAVRLSELDKIFAATLCYSTEGSLIWKGLTLVSPFKCPLAVIVFGVQSEGKPVQREGVHYVLKEDSSLKEVFKSLTTTISNQAQRPVHFEDANASDMIDQSIRPMSLSFKHLKENVKVDSTFMHEMGLLPTIADRVSEASSVSHGGQDVIFINVDSYAKLVKYYGEHSPQVKEASQILRKALSQVQDHFRKLYKDQVVFASLMLDNDGEVSRKKRSIPIFEPPQNVTDKLNIAEEYREDFPVMFNIVLFLSIILIMALIAVSVAMATMDPGRDSIIYRMTNPRMKKDQ